MTNETFLFFAVTQTVFIAIAAISAGYAAHQWWSVWREPETKNKSVSKAMFFREVGYFVMVAIWLVLRLTAWAIGAVRLERSTAIGTYTGITLGFMAMVVGVIAGGVASGWFSVTSGGENVEAAGSPDKEQL